MQWNNKYYVKKEKKGNKLDEQTLLSHASNT